MEAAAAIIGLLAVAGKIYKYLEEFVIACADAPTVAQVTCDEVRDFRYALQRLKPYVVYQSIRISPLGAAVTDTNQLSLTLASCVITFSQLERTLDRLLPSKKMDTIGRLRWTMAGGNLSQLVVRLQQHKLTLTLLLTIWLSESAAQAEELLGRLNDVLVHITAARQQPQPPSTLTMPIYEEPFGDAESSIPATNPQTSILAANQQSTTTSMNSPLIATILSENRPGPAFESILFTSRPYKGVKSMSTSAISLASSQKRGTKWSLFSGGSNSSVFSLPYTTLEPTGTSIAECSNISTTLLPMQKSKLHNPWWYSANSPLSTTREPDLASKERFCLLLDAVQRDDLSTVVREFSIGSNRGLMDADGDAALYLAVRENNSVMTETLLDRNFSTNKKVLTVSFHRAVASNDVAIAAMLLDRGANIETRNDGQTALHLAVESNDLSMIAMLLDRGADIEARNVHGKTTLQLATESSDAPTVKMLLNRGASIEARSGGGKTSLHLAIKSQHKSTTAVLLDRGASIEEKGSDGDGGTLLYSSVESSIRGEEISKCTSSLVSA